MDREIFVERYFPSVLANAAEFADIANAENPEFKSLYGLAQRWFENGFVMDLHEDGAERWEKMLSLTPKTTDDLEQRRQRILARLRSMFPYTHRRLEDILASHFGVGKTSLDFHYDAYLLNVNIDKSVILQKEALYYLLRMIIPANLGIKVRYTMPVAGSGYFGAVAGRRKHLKLITVTGFTLTQAAGNVYFGGIVGLRKKIKIGVVE